MAAIVLAPASVAHAEPSLAEIEKQLEAAGDEMEGVVDAYNKINVELAATQQQIADLNTKLQPLQARMETVSANVDDIAVAAYKGTTPLRTMSLLLTGSSSDTLMDQLATLQQINRHQQRDLAAYTEAKNQHSVEKKRLDDLLATQSAQKAELEAKKVKIEGELKKLDELKRRANAAGRRANDTGAPAGPPPAVSGKVALVLNYAKAQLGKKYKFATAGPDTFDCSGLTMMSWKQAGVNLPRVASDQYAAVRHVSRAQLQPGDLVVYSGGSHIGIYVGNSQIIHAPSSGDVVKYTSIDRMGSPPTGFGRPG